MRIVIDTNVVASAIFFGGRPRELLEKLLLHDFDAYASKEILVLLHAFPKKTQKNSTA